MTVIVCLFAAALTAAALVPILHVGARTFTRDRRDQKRADQFTRDLAAVTADPSLRLAHPDAEMTR